MPNQVSDGSQRHPSKRSIEKISERVPLPESKPASPKSQLLIEEENKEQ